MTFKRVTSAVAGDATHFGGQDVNKYSDYLGGTDIGGSETVDIATLTTFRDSKFTLRNPANTFSYVFVPAAIAASRNVTLPLLTAGDTLVTAAFAQTLTNKTIDASTNTISNIGDSAIAAHTSTKITITTKGQLNSALVYTDQTNTYGDFSSIFRATRVKIRNPANTFSYTITGAGIAADRAVNLPVLTADDTVTFDAFATTLTNKTINATNNTITDTSTAAGDIMASNGTKFVRKARGTALQVLRTNSGATDIEWASLDSERVGKSTASGNASTTVFTIAHGLGSTPTYTFISVGSSGSGVIAAKADSDSTNITVTFASAPSSGSNNVIIYWRVVA